MYHFSSLFSPDSTCSAPKQHSVAGSRASPPKYQGIVVEYCPA